MAVYTKPEAFDGNKFAERYGLDPLSNDFYDDGAGHIVVREGITLPDPPIFDIPDTPEVAGRTYAKDVFVGSMPLALVLRATAAVLLDELNSHADKINAILSAVDAATSLADLKTKMAAIQDYPQRTLAQAKTSITNKIDTGDAD
jgi:hypothetical protein